MDMSAAQISAPTALLVTVIAYSIKQTQSQQIMMNGCQRVSVASVISRTAYIVKP